MAEKKHAPKADEKKAETKRQRSPEEEAAAAREHSEGAQ